MKSFCKNAVVFAFAAAIIVFGLASGQVKDSLNTVIPGFVQNLKVAGPVAAFNILADTIEKSVSDNLRYHDAAMDLNSVYQRILGTAVVEKDDMTVVRAKNNYLGNPRAEVPGKTLARYAGNVAQLCELSRKNGAEFVYIMAPTKGYSLSYPANIKDYTALNCTRFADNLKKMQVPFLNLIDCAAKDGISDEKMFFATDHHWRPEMGIWASEKLTDFLNSEYGFVCDAELWNYDNYNITEYKNWFLGSQGKKAGRWFTPLGADNINIITPSFETDLVEEQPVKGLVRQGSFKDLLYMDNIATKAYYDLNPYAAYSGGDFREQIITNRLNPRGKTAIIIRDSYGCAFTPFISLAMSKTYVVDIRDGGYVGEKVNLTEYISSVKPDYVFVLYTGLTASDSLYTFLD